MALLFKHPLNNMKEICQGATLLHENNRFYFCFKHRLIILQYIIQHFFDKQLFERNFNIQLKFSGIFEIA